MVAAILNGTASTIADGLHVGLTRDQYEAIPAINYSTLKLFSRSPAHAREYMIHPPKPTEAMDFGTACHTAILEPMRFDREYVLAPEEIGDDGQLHHVTRRSNTGKATWAAFEEANRGKGVLSREEMEACRGISEAIYRHSVAKELLSAPGKTELAAIWTDPKTQLRCKALLDRFTRHAGWPVIVDLKTTEDARPREFMRGLVRYSYHEQAAFYIEGLRVLAPGRRKWRWVVTEKDRPFGVAVYEPDDEMLEEGHFLFREHLDQFAECQASGVWPSYPEGIETLTLPRWAKSEQEAV
jgi:hypothetical protein